VQAVQEMEKKMDILVWWAVDDKEYKNAAALVASRHYHMALTLGAITDAYEDHMRQMYMVCT
jgi:hypothetical protein